MAIIDRSFRVRQKSHRLSADPRSGRHADRAQVRRQGTRAARLPVHCCQLAGRASTEADLIATSWQDWYAASSPPSTNCARVRTVVVGGLSMGGVLALHLAAQRPDEVHGLVLYAPTLWYDGWSVPWYRFVLRFALLSAFGPGDRAPGLSVHRKASLTGSGRPPSAGGAGRHEIGDTTQAGILTTPGDDSVCQLYNLVGVVQRSSRASRLRADRAGARRRPVEPQECRISTASHGRAGRHAGA